MVKNDHNSHFHLFHFVHFVVLRHFNKVVNWWNAVKWHFMTVHDVITIRPYGNDGEITQERRYYCVWWFSPLLFLLWVCFLFNLFKMSGRLHRVDFYFYSRSPLCWFFRFLFFFIFKFMSGRLHRRGDIITTLVLPSVVFLVLFYVV